MDRRLLALLALALLIRLAGVFVTPVVWWDEAIYADLGWKLSQNPLDYSFGPFWDRNFGCRECAGFRAPLLPYLLAAIYSIVGNSHIVPELLMPVAGTAGVLGTYLLAKELFDERIALLSALMIAFLPLHAFFSGRILTDVLVTTSVTFTALFFWLGFMRGKEWSRLLFGAGAALSIMARYTAVFMLPVFLAVLLFHHRSLRFLKDRMTLLSWLAFLLVLSPWLLYSQAVYGNPLGAIMHAKESPGYWGSADPWYYYLLSTDLSIAGPLALLGLFMLIRNKDGMERKVLLVLWSCMILASALALENKEMRFLLPLTPALAMFAALPLANVKKQGIVVGIAALILLCSSAAFLLSEAERSYTPEASCFIAANDFILEHTGKDAVVYTDASPAVYHYTRRDTVMLQAGDSSFSAVIPSSEERPVYALWSRYNDPDFRSYALQTGLQEVFRCPSDGSLAVAYKR